MISSLPKLSCKIKNFFEFVQSKAKKSISLKPVSALGLKGVNFAFEHDPACIIIKYLLPFNGSIEQFERSLAHEAGHGLIYGEGYTYFKPNKKLDDAIAFSLNISATMIDDIPVNKVIQDHGFEAFPEIYLSMVKKEEKAAKMKNMSIYSNTGPNDMTQNRFAIYRYVTAWAYLQYFTMRSIQKDTVRKFRKNFKQSYPNLSKEGAKICELFNANDVFSSNGHENILKEVLSLWKLDEFVNFIRTF